MRTRLRKKAKIQLRQSSRRKRQENYHQNSLQSSIPQEQQLIQSSPQLNSSSDEVGEKQIQSDKDQPEALGKNFYTLRPKKSINIFENLKLQEGVLRESYGELFQDDGYEESGGKRRRKRRVDILEDDFQYEKGDGVNNHHGQEIDEDIYDQNFILDKLPKKKVQLERLYEKVCQKINGYKKLFFAQQAQLRTKLSYVAQTAIPICADIRNFNFSLLKKKQLEFGQRQFDVIMMDPPWKLSSSQPSRGVAIQYDSLADQIIEQIPINQLQSTGFICIWAINAKYRFTCKLIQKWGYKLVDEITWVKKTINGKIAKGHGFYLQHAKESCLIGVKGNVDRDPRFIKNVASDVIFSERRGQSQKPTQVYEYLQKLVPNGFYLQIFGRRNNLRKNWVTIGNEI